MTLRHDWTVVPLGHVNVQFFFDKSLINYKIHGLMLGFLDLFFDISLRMFIDIFIKL